MLTKERYQEISKDWAKHNVVYQKFDRYQVRFPTFLKHIDVFKGKNVLEVGSNAGLAAYHIAQVAKSYTGVENEEGYCKQALETQKSIENKNVKFFNMSIKTFIRRTAQEKIEKRPIDAVYLSYVLYHFSDKEVDMFAKNILPNIDTIIVQSRFAKRNKKGRRTHNGYAFWHPRSVKNFLQKNGFAVTLEWGPDKKFHFVVGKKTAVSSNPILNRMVKPTEKPTEKIAGIQLKEFDVVEESGEITKEQFGAIVTKEAPIGKEEKPDGDKGDGEVHTEEKAEASEGQGTRSGEGRVDKRKSRGTAGRKTDSERKSGDVRAEDTGDRGKDILQPVVEKSTEKEVCDPNIQEVAKAVPNRSRAKTTQARKRTRKPAVQKDAPQSDSPGNKDAAC